MLLVVAGIAVAVLAIALALAVAAGRARARALAEQVRSQVEPYLRRRCAEHGIPAAAPTWTARTPPEQIVAYSSQLAAKVLERERSGAASTPPGATTDLGHATTQPVRGE
jgi:hypothetical protein